MAYVTKKEGCKNQSIFLIKCLKSSLHAPSSGFSGFHLYFFNFSTDSSLSPSPMHVLSHFIVAFIFIANSHERISLLLLYSPQLNSIQLNSHRDQFQQRLAYFPTSLTCVSVTMPLPERYLRAWES